MRLRRLWTLCALLSFCSTVFAQEITGTVTNLTISKPSAGDTVVLLKLAQGMEEVIRTTTDAQGRFILKVEDTSAPHLIRVNHRNVNYFKSAPRGTTSVEVNVYDAAEKVDGVKQTLDIMRMEGDATNLRVVELFAVENKSSPPRTLMSMKSFEFQLPKGARLDQAMAAGPGSMPVTTSPAPQGDDKYAFLFPLRPGETRFQVAYTLPYPGSSTTFSPKLLQPVESYAASVPRSMTLEPEPGSGLKPSGEDSGMVIFVAQNAQPGQNLAFKVSGTGAIPEAPAEGQGQPGGPGGGIGTPIGGDTPLKKYQWWIIGGIAVLMVVGAAFAMKAQPHPAYAPPATPLDVLKEEMFHLETDLLSGKLSEDEYAKAKAALDVVMKRALERKS